MSEVYQYELLKNFDVMYIACKMLAGRKIKDFINIMRSISVHFTYEYFLVSESGRSVYL